MKQNTNQLEITRDGQPTNEFDPTVLDASLGRVQAAVGALSLQVRMFTFDTLHGTNYRSIRNQLVEQKRREDFERSIGLMAIDH